MTPQRGPRCAPEAAPPRPEDSPPPEDAAARLLPRPPNMPASESLAAGSRMVRVATEPDVEDPAAVCSWDSDAARLLKMVDTENLEGLQALLGSGIHVNGHGGTFHETALHRAAQVRWAAGVRFLLAAGASVYAKNQFGQTPLHYAAASKSTTCIQLLLENRRPGVVDHRDMRGHTPLHDAAAAGCVHALSLLLKAGALVRAKDGTGSTPLHKAARARSVPCMVALLNAGADMAAADDNGETVLAYTLHYMPGLMDTVFDECLVTNSHKINTKTLEVTMNFLPLCCGSDKNQVQNLQSFVDLGHAKLLSHPLCETFLLLKWMNVRRLFLIEVILYLFFAVLTTVLTFNKFVWNDSATDTAAATNTTAVIGDTALTNDTEAAAAVATGEEEAVAPSEKGFDSLPHSANQTMRVLVMVYQVLIILQQVLSLLQNKLQWFRSLSGVLHVVITVLVAAVVLPADARVWQQHLASWLMLLLWTECMLLIGRFPNCGVYVVMFTRVAKVFLRIFLMYFCLLLAFTAAFYVALNVQQGGGQQDPVLASPILTFVKTLTMMIGELDFSTEFVEGLSKLYFTGHAIFLFFIILVSIILSNLLVALAVSDVQSLRNSAHLERLIKQTELVFHMEKNISTASFIASHVRVSKLSAVLMKVALVCTYDCYNTRVFYLPNSPLKSNKLFIVKNKNVKETSVPSYLLANVNRCLRGREADQQTTGGGDIKLGKSMRSARRGSRIRRGDYQRSEENNDEFKAGLKELEEIVGDRMEEVRETYTGLQKQMRDLEEKLNRITSLLTKDGGAGDDSVSVRGEGRDSGRGGGGGSRRGSGHSKVVGPNLSLPPNAVG
ncbi:transient receptor potential channel pyrexia-like [Eriocheir sinensis]|uniref:transient receptor potential channel pyrexia-like n=1 Tax=Eriocheir sinensis TaxID=95602 RepID=UPI0021C79F81|nr:transient receptor potential channel pyrexia-like [Eriocheir sinensis]XP_050728875.1 transient receptor potential channel pyrexia-like [Eriocheir sinensis]XP_050728876.1 transient receptor potential channel pyrexia-like [Eriocheir sinensis]XP_050728877.1 transient receptor potential channel pyrexia-like [Eriocheir sinensis]XP_050728878.1 transient receptor potential channel pyrexia-like [Eriocheir sinensis]